MLIFLCSFNVYSSAYEIGSDVHVDIVSSTAKVYVLMIQYNDASIANGEIWLSAAY